MTGWVTRPANEQPLLGSYLRNQLLSVPDRLNGLAQLIEQIAEACSEVGERVARCEAREADAADERTNPSGDTVHALDRIADDVFVKRMEDSGSCAGVVSEERALPEVLLASDAPYLVALDPLDGSSNLGCAMPVGTIFSVRTRGGFDPGDPASYLRSGREQVAAGYAIYGSMTELVLATRRCVCAFWLGSDRRWRLRDDGIRVPTRGRIYSANEANVARWQPELQAWLESCKEQGYTQRYVGSLVADVHRTLFKGGVFLYPGDLSTPEGKLRLLYEAAPMALVFEAAGGMASDGRRPLLDAIPAAIHERTPVVLGGRAEIRAVEQVLERSPGQRWRISTGPASRGGHRIACAFELGGRRVSGHLQLSPNLRRHRFVSSGATRSPSYGGNAPG